MSVLEPIPDSEKLEWKKPFEERYKALLGDRYEEFKKISLCFLRKAIRVNTLKIGVDELKERLEGRWNLTQVPWAKEGFWISGKRRDVGNMLEHMLGYFYIQEPASMIPPIVLRPKPHELVLDMCASPGSKSTQLAQYMENKGLLIANDVTADRLKALGMNLQRCGVSNTMITLMHGRKIKGMEFDRILVDAPCSGTGTIRKSLKTLSMWNPNMVKRIAGTQRQLITTAFECLKPGGTMVYSTCTLEPDEDEAIIDYLVNKFDDAKVDKIELDINKSDPVTHWDGKEFDPQVKRCLRIYPQDNDTEGFFVTRIKKLE